MTGIEIGWHPDLLVGPWRIAWHSIFALVGLVVGSQISIALARQLVRDDRLYWVVAAVVVGGLFTARLFHVLDNWDRYAARPQDVFAFWNGGIAVTGSIVGAAVASYATCRVLRLPLGFIFDVAVIGIAVGFAIGRLGDIVNGEHHAVSCAALPWCVRYTHPETLGQAHFVHPVVAYDLLWDLVIAAICFSVWRRVRGRTPEGRVFWTFVALYGGGRFVSSFLRLDPIVLAGLQEAQVLGLGYVAAGAFMYWRLARAPARA